MLSYYYHHSKYPITTSASSTPTSSSHISIARIKNFSSNLSTNENDLSSSINTDPNESTSNEFCLRKLFFLFWLAFFCSLQICFDFGFNLCNTVDLPFKWPYCDRDPSLNDLLKFKAGHDHGHLNGRFPVN